MSTQRLAVRDALIGLIETATGLTVYRNLDYAIETKRLPAVAVVSGPDDVDDETSDMDDPGYEARFAVHLLVASSADPEAAADAYEDLIRAAVAASPSLSDLALDTTYRGGDWDFDLGSCAARQLSFSVRFIDTE